MPIYPAIYQDIAASHTIYKYKPHQSLISAEMRLFTYCYVGGSLIYGTDFHDIRVKCIA